ncbi:MAG: hypothetical protein EXR75_14100 [Myxococcales bacterium]|nr:hypothetical protein [Myxococcales bacterium]
MPFAQRCTPVLAGHVAHDLVFDPRRARTSDSLREGSLGPSDQLAVAVVVEHLLVIRVPNDGGVGIVAKEVDARAGRSG